MATNLGSVYGELVLDSTKWNNAIKGAEKQVNSFASSTAKGLSSLQGAIGSMGGAFINASKQAAVLAEVGLGLGVAGLSLAIKDSIEKANIQQEAMTQTMAVIKSTGKAAGISAIQVWDLASALQDQTTYGDESIISAQNLLLTFTNIGKDVFPDATSTVLDMSTALGQDLKSSAIQLGKALQDPILGVSALRRVGVNFSESQQDMIKNLVKTGKVMEAQKYILKELNTEFGGSATAMRNTVGGEFTALKNRIGDLQEVIGDLSNVYLYQFIQRINELLPTAQQFRGVIYKIQEVFDGLQTALSGEGFTQLNEALQSFGVSPEQISMIDGFLTGVKSFGEWVVANKDIIIQFLTGMAIGFAALAVIGMVTQLLTALTNPLNLLVIVAGLLYIAWQNNFLGIQDITKQVVENLIKWWGENKEYFIDSFNIIKKFTKAFIDSFMQWWDKYGNDVIRLVKDVWGVISGAFVMVFNTIMGLLKIFTGLFTGDWNLMWEGVKQIASGFWEFFLKVMKLGIDASLVAIKGLKDAFIKFFSDMFDSAKKIADNIRETISKAFDVNKRNSPSIMDRLHILEDSVNTTLNNIKIPSFSADISSSIGELNTDIGGGNTQSPVLNVYIGTYAGSNMEKRALAKELWDSLQDYNRSIGANIVG